MPNTGLSYQLVTTLVNAAHYGVAQKRERVFIVGFRRDLDVQWSFPHETHALGALLHEQWVTGAYWDRHGIAKKDRPEISNTHAATVARLRGLGLPPTRAPWLTVRDAIHGLPEPQELEGDVFNHRLQVGARSYPGHTGSPPDLPAKTLKAGGHGVPGGENMMVRTDGSVRYFSIRESARLQSFPDGYLLHGAWGEAMRQLGNAVPVRLAHVVASSVARHLLECDHRRMVAHQLERQLELTGLAA